MASLTSLRADGALSLGPIIITKEASIKKEGLSRNGYGTHHDHHREHYHDHHHSHDVAVAVAVAVAVLTTAAAEAETRSPSPADVS
jgi:hypothetical protein